MTEQPNRVFEACLGGGLLQSDLKSLSSTRRPTWNVPAVVRSRIGHLKTWAVPFTPFSATAEAKQAADASAIIQSLRMGVDQDCPAKISHGVCCPLLTGHVLCVFSHGVCLWGQFFGGIEANHSCSGTEGCLERFTPIPPAVAASSMRSNTHPNLPTPCIDRPSPLEASCWSTCCFGESCQILHTRWFHFNSDEDNFSAAKLTCVMDAM